MKIPVLEGVIKRRMLINFRIDLDVMQKFLPAPFRPKLHRNYAMAGICLIRLEHIRPKGLPRLLGFSSENAAHRIAVEWDDAGRSQEGVFIPRRDTGSLLNHLTGGRIFSGEHHLAKFRIVDEGERIDFSMESCDQKVAVRVQGRESSALPTASCFASLDQASAFFECGSLGYSVTHDSCRLDGLRLKTLDWRVRALHVDEVESSFFSDRPPTYLRRKSHEDCHRGRNGPGGNSSGAGFSSRRPLGCCPFAHSQIGSLADHHMGWPVDWILDAAIGRRGCGHQSRRSQRELPISRGEPAKDHRFAGRLDPDHRTGHCQGSATATNLASGQHGDDLRASL
jgi:hypothetical protein